METALAVGLARVIAARKSTFARAKADHAGVRFLQPLPVVIEEPDLQILADHLAHIPRAILPVGIKYGAGNQADLAAAESQRYRRRGQFPKCGDQW